VHEIPDTGQGDFRALAKSSSDRAGTTNEVRERQIEHSEERMATMTDASGEYPMMAPPSDGVKENQAMTKVRANPSVPHPPPVPRPNPPISKYECDFLCAYDLQ
jgi:hypothetical protein